MLSRIDRYLIKEVMLTFLAAVLVLLAVALSHRLAEYLGKAASGLLARDAVLLLLGLQLIRLLVILIPPAFLLAIMLALGRLYRDNEMTALTACGLGPGAVYRPLFLLAVPMAAILAGLALYIVPMAMDLQFELQIRARQSAQLSLFNPGTFREVAGGEHVIYVGSLTDDGQEVRNVFIQSRTRDGIAITTGERGHQRIDPDTGARYIVLANGHRYQGNPGQENYQSVQFARLAVRVDAPPPEQTWLRREAVSTSELWVAPSPSYWAELHKRISGPISLLLLTFLAPLLARASPREGRYGRVVAAILIYTIYINLLSMGEAWIKRETIWVGLGLWWVHGLVGLLGLLMWRHHYGKGVGIARRLADRKRL